MISTVLEVGPAIVRSCPNQQSGAKVRVEICKTLNSVEMVAAALAGIDDTTVLLDEQPVAVADLWRRIITLSAGSRCESLTLVHPSWWPEHRVARVVDAAAAVADDVRPLARSDAIGANDPATVIEIADEVVAICSPAGPPLVLRRPEDPRDIVQSVETSTGTRVLIDAPPGVAGATEYARVILATLRQRGVPAQLAGIRDVLPAAPVAEALPVTTPRRWRRPALAVMSAVVTLCAIGATAARTHEPAPALGAANLIEGRITVRIPPQWAVTRITAGPGSRRIQASSPTEPNVALHVTQSYAPGETLDRTADVLRQAVAEQPRGVFVDFNPADRRGGRRAVTYREIRAGRDVRWTVVLDGATRISVGCQSAPGHEDAVAEPCEKAIESAHEVKGTNGPS